LAAHDTGSTVTHSLAFVGSSAKPAFHAAAEIVIGATGLQVTTIDGVATGFTIVIFRVVTNPSAVEVKVAVPGPTPANKPVESTVKTFVSDEDQVELIAGFNPFV
jgi:hypothetical protein